MWLTTLGSCRSSSVVDRFRVEPLRSYLSCTGLSIGNTWHQHKKLRGSVDLRGLCCAGAHVAHHDEIDFSSECGWKVHAMEAEEAREQREAMLQRKGESVLTEGMKL